MADEPDAEAEPAAEPATDSAAEPAVEIQPAAETQPAAELEAAQNVDEVAGHRAGIIQLSPPVEAASMSIPRATRAAFIVAGVPEIVEAREEGTPMSTGTEVVVQLMGLIPSLDVGSVTATSTLRFVARFYDFVPVPTPAATLSAVVGVEGPLLFTSVPDAGLAAAPPDGATAGDAVAATLEPMASQLRGLVLRFLIPGGVEGVLLAEYLRNGTMEIEAWDEDSLIHLGTAAVRLDGLLGAGSGQSNGVAEPEVSLSAALLEPILPEQDARHAGRCAGWLQLRLARLGESQSSIPVT